MACTSYSLTWLTFFLGLGLLYDHLYAILLCFIAFYHYYFTAPNYVCMYVCSVVYLTSYDPCLYRAAFYQLLMSEYVVMLCDALLVLCCQCRHMNSRSLLCDCHLSWLASWLSTTNVNVVNVTELHCAHPASVHGRSFIDVDAEQFICGMIQSPLC